MSNTLTPEIRQAVVLDVVRIAREKYVLPELGGQIAQAIQAKQEQGGYNHILEASQLVDTLTSDLRQASNDQHWQVSYDSKLTSAQYADEDAIDAEALDLLKEKLRKSNFGIAKVEHMPGNIGYVDLHGFAWIGFPGAGDSIVAAMQLVAYCDALIFDMRQNRGGEVETLQLYLSYLVNDDPRHYDTFHYRPTDEYQQFWTYHYVPGKRMPDVPIYILTSTSTGSGGEAFAYILKNLRRATVIGETTLGAAHTTDMEIVQENFQVEFPSGRSISPFTKGDWEGTGVVPDLSVSREDAMSVAHLYALEQLIKQCKDDRQKRLLDWDLEIAKNQYAPVAVEETTLSRYIGQYGDRAFTLVDGSLVYSRQGLSTTKLVPLSKNRFRFDDLIKFEFRPDEQGKFSSVVVSYRDRPDISLGRG
jgi:hypothetical protein